MCCVFHLLISKCSNGIKSLWSPVCDDRWHFFLIVMYWICSFFLGHLPALREAANKTGSFEVTLSEWYVCFRIYECFNCDYHPFKKCVYTQWTKSTSEHLFWCFSLLQIGNSCQYLDGPICIYQRITIGILGSRWTQVFLL